MFQRQQKRTYGELEAEDRIPDELEIAWMISQAAMGSMKELETGLGAHTTATGQYIYQSVTSGKQSGPVPVLQQYGKSYDVVGERKRASNSDRQLADLRGPDNFGRQTTKGRTKMGHERQRDKTMQLILDDIMAAPYIQQRDGLNERFQTAKEATQSKYVIYTYSHSDGQLQEDVGAYNGVIRTFCEETTIGQVFPPYEQQLEQLQSFLLRNSAKAMEDIEEVYEGAVEKMGKDQTAVNTNAAVLEDILLRNATEKSIEAVDDVTDKNIWIMQAHTKVKNILQGLMETIQTYLQDLALPDFVTEGLYNFEEYMQSNLATDSLEDSGGIATIKEILEAKLSAQTAGR